MGSIFTVYEPQVETPSLNLEEITEQLENASSAASETYAAIADLLTGVATTGITIEEYVPGEQLTYNAAPPMSVATPPNLDIAGLEFLGEVPDLPGLDISIGSAPEPFFTKPTFNIPEPPDVDWPTFTTDPPAASPIDLPTAPSVTLPDPPSIQEVIVPAPPSTMVPAFEGVAPNIDLTPPALNYSWSETPYTSALMTAIRERIESDVAIGGSGYSATVEQQIYDREVARTDAEEEAAVLAALEASCNQGWMLPPGEAMGKVIDLSHAVNKRREELNDKIVTQQTELSQKNTHLAMTTAIQVETILLHHHNNVQQRSFEAAKFAIDAAMELYRAKVEAFRARAQAFTVLAKVYDARIRAEIVKAELYKAHIDGLKTGVEANNLKVQVYKSQLLGIKALVDMYKAEMQAGRVLAEVERTRIEGYMAQVEAYKARIEAIEARYDGYVAQVRGEIIKADMVKAEAQAYKATAHAYRTQAEVELEEARASIDALRAQIQMYSSQVQKYLVDIEYVIGIGKANQQHQGAIADLKVIEARYNAAVKDLDAKLFHAATVENAGLIRATATIATAEQSAATTVKEAAEQAIRAANDAVTTITVATNASDTTSSSANHRQSFNTDKSDTESTNRSSSTNVNRTYSVQNIHTSNV